MTSSAQVLELRRETTSEDFIPYVEPGVYKLAYVRHETARLFRQTKLVIWFRIVDMGEDFGRTIPRYYNVKRFRGKTGKNGAFVAGRSSDFIREYARLFPNPIHRLDRVAMEPFKKNILVGNARTVTKDREQRDLAKTLRYSVVGSLTGIDND